MSVLCSISRHRQLGLVVPPTETESAARQLYAVRFQWFIRRCSQKHRPADASHTGGSGLMTKRQPGDQKHYINQSAQPRLEIDLRLMMLRRSRALHIP